MPFFSYIKVNIVMEINRLQHLFYMRGFLIYSFIFLGLTINGLAQAESPFANPESWKKVSTDYFDVYFSGNDQEGARQTARYAEIARYEIGTLFDFKPDQKYTLIYASHPVKFMQTNLRIGTRDKNPSKFLMPRGWGQVIFPGTNGDWFKETKRAVTKLIIEEFAHGDRMSTAIQSQMLFYNALWFKEGLEEYVGYGWTFEDEMWISSILNEDLLDLAQEGNGRLNKIVRKSIWHYIVHEYGEQKISEILYLVNISHSIESGVISVLGITLRTLTSRWREYITMNYSNQKKSRVSLSQLPEASHIPIKEGYELIGSTYNENEDVFALYLHKNGRQTVFTFDEGSNKLSSTLIESGFTTNESPWFSFQVPMVWNHASNTLLTTAFVKGEYSLAYYDLIRKEASYTAIPQEIENISHLSWSHDDRKIVLSALTGSQVEIYTLTSGSTDFERLTNDSYDDLHPEWSMDDRSIFFSSNRRMDISDSMVQDIFRNTLDLYVMNARADSIVQLTETPYINETNPMPISSFELKYLSDEVGLLNLSIINVFKRTVEPISNLAQGAFSFWASERNVILQTPDNGQNGLYLVSPSAFIPIETPEPTLLRFEMTEKIQRKEKRLALMFSPPRIDSAKTEKKEPEKEEKPEKKKPVRYYIFDEEEEPYEIRRSKREKTKKSESLPLTVSKVFGELPRPTVESVEISGVTQAPKVWKTDYVGLGFNFDPIANLGLELTAGFSDLFNNHKVEVEVQPFFNLRNTFSRVRYSYLKNKLDLWGEARYNTRFFREPNAFNTDSMVFRFNHLQLMGGARYPLSSFASIEAGLGYFFLDRKDLQTIHTRLLDDRDHLVGARITFNFDNVKEKEGFQYQGVAVNAGVESYYSFQQNNFAFHRARLQATAYTEVANKIVLAGRLGASFNLPRSLPQYYLGGVDDRVHPPIVFPNDQANNTIRNNSIDTSLHSFQFIDFVQNLHGFRPNTRDGSRFIIANLELRIPLSRLLRYNLSTSPLYKLEIIPFIDAGTVWVEGNPFSKKEPTDTQIISTGVLTVKLQTLKSPFLIGFGSGVRTNILGWSLRMDLAWGVDDYNIQRPMLTTSVGKNF
jgi:hypothetical protein